MVFCVSLIRVCLFRNLFRIPTRFLCSFWSLLQNMDKFGDSSNDNMHPGHSATVFYSPSASFSVSLCRGVWGVIPGRGGSKNNPLPEGSAKVSPRCPLLHLSPSVGVRVMLLNLALRSIFRLAASTQYPRILHLSPRGSYHVVTRACSHSTGSTSGLRRK